MKPKRRNPEMGLQIRVRRMLMMRLPDDVFWIGGAAGLRMTPVTRMKAKATGALNRGWPDLTFMRAGRCYFIELKKDGKARLSSEQEAFRDACASTGNWAMCWTIEDVEISLAVWGIFLSPEFADDGAYDDGLSMGEAFE